MCCREEEEGLRPNFYRIFKGHSSKTYLKLEKSSPRYDRTGHTFPGASRVNLSDSSHNKTTPKIPDLTSDQEFAEFLAEFDYPETSDDLEEWSDDIDLFIEGLCNPHMIEELQQQSKAKKLWESFHSSYKTNPIPEKNIP